MPPRTTLRLAARSIPAQLRDEVDRLRTLRRRIDPAGNSDLLGRIDGAIEAGECPTCAESQADGVPCATADRDCERCGEALAWVRSLRGEIEGIVETRSAARDDGEI